MIRNIKTFEVIFSTNNLSGMHISTMWHSLNVLKYFCPLSVYGLRTVNSRYIEAGYNEIPAYSKWDISPRVPNASIFIRL